MTRRTVRVDQQFFTELDAQLGETRGPKGEPSASDFLLIELPTIAETFGERFDELLRLYPERDDYRYLVAGGRLVYAVVVVGQLIKTTRSRCSASRSTCTDLDSRPIITRWNLNLTRILGHLITRETV